MNNLKRILISIALAIVTIATIFPPWQYTFQNQGISQVVKPAGYHLIFNPPKPELDAYSFGVKLDVNRYLYQVFAITILLLGSLYLLKLKNRQD